MSAVLKLGIRNTQPLYLAARDQLLKSLAMRTYAPGTALPPEKDLAAQYGISIGTLRKAVDELVAEGILIRQQGRGTFVASHDQDRLLYYFFHIVAVDGRKSSYPDVQLVGFEKGRADDRAANRLKVASGAAVIRLRNLLRLDGVVIMIDDITLPASQFPRLSEARVRNRPGTLYQLYQDDFGHTITRTSERLRAVAAPADIGGLLNLPLESPVMQVHRLALGYSDEPIEWRVSHVDTRTHEYFNELDS